MKILIWLIIIILVVFGIYYATRNDEPVATPETTNTPTNSTDANTGITSTTNPSTGSSQGTVKAFTVTGDNFSFSVKEMKVKQGDTVRVTFKNMTGTHDWKIDEFNAATRILKTGEEQTIEFVANKKGTFEYYCSVGTHRQMGMKGNLIVE